MGFLYYGAETQPAEMPDRVLAHLKLVTTTKLRRGESFTLTWRHAPGESEGRTSIWMQPSIPLRFVFESPEAEKLDPEYLQVLAAGANSANGLIVDWQDEAVDTLPPRGARDLAAA